MRRYDDSEWEAIRARGESAFLLRQGLVFRGLPLGALMSLVVMNIQGVPIPDGLVSWSYAATLLFCIAIFTVTGSLAARATWKVHEHEHGPSD